MVFQPVLAANRAENAPTATAREQQITERDALIAELRRDLGAAEVRMGRWPAESSSATPPSPSCAAISPRLR